MTIQEQEDLVRVQVNYRLPKVGVIIIAVLILLPVIVVIPVLASDMAKSPETAPLDLNAIVIIAILSGSGLLAWVLWCAHEQMISVNRQDGRVEIVDAHGFIKSRRFYKLDAIQDIVVDSKASQNEGEKYFLWMSYQGKKIRLTSPSTQVTTEGVERIYKAIRRFIPLPPAIQRLAYFSHIQVSEVPNQVSLTFRTQLQFIFTRYRVILITMLAFFATMIFLDVAILIMVPTLFLYPGLLLLALPLLFLGWFLPWRKKHLAHNGKVATIVIHTDLQTIQVHTSIKGSPRDYPPTPFTSVSVAPLGSDGELTFVGEFTAEYKSYFQVGLKMGNQEVYFYETESHAEALHIQDFLEGILLGNKK